MLRRRDQIEEPAAADAGRPSADQPGPSRQSFLLRKWALRWFESNGSGLRFRPTFGLITSPFQPELVRPAGGLAGVDPPSPKTARAFLANRPHILQLYRFTDTAMALAVLFGVFIAANLDRAPNGLGELVALRVTIKNLLLLVGFAVVWSQIFNSLGLYSARRMSTGRNEFGRILAACSLGSLPALSFTLTSNSGSFHFRAVFYFWLGTVAATLSGRYAIRYINAFAAARQRRRRHLIIVGSGPRAHNLYREICADPDHGYELLGFIDATDRYAHEEVKPRLLGTLDELETLLVNHVVDEVLIALPIKSCYAEIQNAIRLCEKVGVESKYLSDIFQFSLARPRYEQTDRFSVVTMKVVHDDHRLLVKRAIDILGALAGLIIFGPLMLLAAIAVKATSKGPIIFAQERYGLNKRRFRMYKFRTMVTGAEALQATLEQMNEASGPVFKIKNDPRITPVGRILRKLSIDELPQLFNVLRGDMSLVGPRPLPLRDVSKFSEAWLMRRFSVKPGLTCLWQISGRSNLGFDRWVELDLKYIDEWSLGLDLEILAKTFPAVLKGAGAV
jgi:exopolysaccharide biosynthesis polyprenyl glycosylphosphotransferase